MHFPSWKYTSSFSSLYFNASKNLSKAWLYSPFLNKSWPQAQIKFEIYFIINSLCSGGSSSSSSYSSGGGGYSSGGGGGGSFGGGGGGSRWWKGDFYMKNKLIIFLIGLFLLPISVSAKNRIYNIKNEMFFMSIDAFKECLYAPLKHRLISKG